jgi:hypothetical protein
MQKFSLQDIAGGTTCVITEYLDSQVETIIILSKPNDSTSLVGAQGKSLWWSQ